ncbi:putative membrane protein [Candidatus Rhodobacter oscarellae]|uniref:Putative membrane protein n=1 Tax=Candidatus Rhodobacter oscarellae TaxID=1675527 RepID=A0A0J9EAC6_9RHOB|nr:HupE/UreJ family protein [Candidatus Rhodobacter lobularis]KMW59737.1 putative membrane protein [Candidatus Rhodobacter lobularis]
MSTVIALALSLVNAAQAHELRPAIADVSVGADEVSVEIELALEALVAEIDVSEIDDTDAAPNAARYDALRAMDPAALEAELRGAWDGLAENFLFSAGEAGLRPAILSVAIPEVGDLDLVRDSRITLSAALPDDGTPVTIGWTANNGPLVIRQVDAGDDAYSALLDGGEVSEALPRQGYAAETAGSVFWRFIIEGFEHIIPKGADHIVFVLGLFFFSLAVRPLLAQVTAFTVAHTVTLALAALGIVTIPASIVEPLIAASIVFVAVENIVRPQLGIWRTVVVFVFGLLHGLGFASVLGELGGGQTHFLSRLIGFNIGVELGQLAVIAVAFVLVGLPFGKRDWYRSAIAIPASLVIALIGVHWVMDRVFDLGFLGFVPFL